MKFKIEIQFIIALLHLPNIKRKVAHKLLKDLDQDIYSIGELIEYIADKGNIKWKSFLSMDDFDNAMKKARKILQDSAINNIKIISILDENYPKLLGQCDDPPIILNYIGNINLLSTKPTIAIIGTRNPSAFGERYSECTARFFAKKGFNVISGLAKGCDTAAHLGCIDALKTTSAILAHGLDIVYPKENESLAERIKEIGVLVSEYFVGTPVSRKHFIDRDRIQAALSLGVFIIECDIKSGTMHTANYAVAYNRILTCMKPPLEHFKETRVEGNMLLTQTGKAIGVYEDTELEELTIALRKDFYK